MVARVGVGEGCVSAGWLGKHDDVRSEVGVRQGDGWAAVWSRVVYSRVGCGRGRKPGIDITVLRLFFIF